MHAVALNATLTRSPEPSSTEALTRVVLDALEGEGVTTDVIRLVDHVIEPGVVSEAVSDADEWPALRERILAADILVLATPTWLGQPASPIKRALERMDAKQLDLLEQGAGAGRRGVPDLRGAGLVGPDRADRGGQPARGGAGAAGASPAAAVRVAGPGPHAATATAGSPGARPVAAS